MATKPSKKTKSHPASLKAAATCSRTLRLPNRERELLKARLTLQIYRVIKERKLTQSQAGEILGIQQPHVSSLMRGQSGAFSVERLMDFLAALGHDIEIAVSPSRKEHGEMSVTLR